MAKNLRKCDECPDYSPDLRAKDQGRCNYYHKDLRVLVNAQEECRYGIPNEDYIRVDESALKKAAQIPNPDEEETDYDPGQ